MGLNPASEKLYPIIDYANHRGGMAAEELQEWAAAQSIPLSRDQAVALIAERARTQTANP